MRQRRRLASHYAIEFRTFAISCGWNGQAQYDFFLNGLSDAIHDEIMVCDPPATFDQLVDLAIQIDIG